MRQILLDTETTGLEPKLGHRIIEIGALEIVHRRVTGEVFHVYLNPEREVDPGAVEVHGLTNDFLQDKPRFREVVQDLLRFVAGAELVIHNAPFDVGFLNAELARLDRGRITDHCLGVQDTLKLARQLHPGQKNNLDALCRRYAVDNSGRAFHGALLDAQLLGEVYLAMTRGQESLAIEQPISNAARQARNRAHATIKVLRASAEERAAHAAYLGNLSKECVEVPVW